MTNIEIACGIVLICSSILNAVRAFQDGKPTWGLAFAICSSTMLALVIAVIIPV